MKTSRFSETQVVTILNEALTKELTIEQLCRKHGISIPTYYKWRQKYGGLEKSDILRMRSLVSENSRLKKLVAEQALALDIVKELNSKNGLGYR